MVALEVPFYLGIAVKTAPLVRSWFAFKAIRVVFVIRKWIVSCRLIFIRIRRYFLLKLHVGLLLVQQRLFVPGTIRWLFAVALVHGSFIGGFYAQQSFLQETLGVSPTVGGLVLIPTVAAFVIGTLAGTRLAARANDLRTSILGFFGTAIAFLLLALAVAQQAESAMIACDLIAGFFIGIATPRLHHLILTNVPSAQVGAASGGIVFATHSGEGLGIIFFAGIASMASDTLSAVATSATMLAMGAALSRSLSLAKGG